MRPTSGDVANPFGARLAAERLAVALGDEVEDQRLDIGLAEHALALDGTDLAVDSNRRTRLRREIQCRRASRRGDAEQAIDARRVQRLRETGGSDRSYLRCARAAAPRLDAPPARLPEVAAQPPLEAPRRDLVYAWAQRSHLRDGRWRGFHGRRSGRGYRRSRIGHRFEIGIEGDVVNVLR